MIEREGRPLTSAYYVAALDRQFNDEGEIELRDEKTADLHGSLISARWTVDHDHGADDSARLSDRLLHVDPADALFRTS